MKANSQYIETYEVKGMNSTLIETNSKPNKTMNTTTMNTTPEQLESFVNQINARIVAAFREEGADAWF
ncbi:MAG: hypothetical protein ACO3RV_09260, partial [Luteolibacter sp.]